MDDDNNLDTHLCLSCQLRMVGLDNYIRHKKVECPSLRRQHLNYSRVDVIDDYNSMKSTEPNNRLFPSPRDMDVSQSNLADSSSDDDYAIDCFFQSLELRQRHRLSANSCSRQKLPSVDTILTSPSFDVCTALTTSLRYNAATTSDTEDWFSYPGDDVTNGFLLGTKSMDMTMDHLLPLSEKWNLNETQSTPEDNCNSNRSKNTKIDSESTVDDKYRCTVCEVTYRTKYSYARHLTTALHKRRAKGYCQPEPKPDIENTSLDSSDKLRELMTKQKSVQCRACGFFGDTKSELLEHLKRHPVGFAKKDGLRCVRCRYRSRTCEEMIQHVQTKQHDAVIASSSQPCIIRCCGGRHDDQNDSGDGLRSKRQSTVNSLAVCEFCSASFKSQSRLVIHRRRHHTHDRPFTCASCNKSFNNNGSLIAHNRTTRHIKRVNSQLKRNSSTD